MMIQRRGGVLRLTPERMQKCDYDTPEHEQFNALEAMPGLSVQTHYTV